MLRVNETATYIDIYCDGYVARVHKDGSDAFLGEILDPNDIGTAWYTFGSKVVVGGTTYAISEDLGISVALVENTSLRVVVSIVGDYETSAQSSLADESGSTLMLTFEADRITQAVTFNATAIITLSDNVGNGICFMDAVTGNIANERGIYERNYSEKTVDSNDAGDLTAPDYIAILSDECDVMGVARYEHNKGTATFAQYVYEAGEAIRHRWNNGTTFGGEMTCTWVLDSADRTGGKQYGGEFVISDPETDDGDLTFYWDCDYTGSSPQTANYAAGSATITIAGAGVDQETGYDGSSNSAIGVSTAANTIRFLTASNIIPAEGHIGFWYKPAYDPQTNVTYKMLISANESGANTGDMALWAVPTEGRVQLFFTGDTTADTPTFNHDNEYHNMTEGVWAYHEIYWNSTYVPEGIMHNIGWKIDGTLIRQTSKTDDIAWTASAFPTNIYLLTWVSNTLAGIGVMDEFSISSNADIAYYNPPKRLTIGRQFKKNNVRQRVYIEASSVIDFTDISVTGCILELTNGSDIAVCKYRRFDIQSYLAPYEVNIRLDYPFSGSTTKVAILTDLHYGDNVQFTTDAEVNAAFGAAIDDIDDIITGVSHVFVLGDIAYDDETGYDTYKTKRGTSDISTANWHELAGNHDVLDADAAPSDGFETELGYTYAYNSVTVDNITFIMISGVGSVTGERVSTAEHTFLLAELDAAAAASETAIILGHVPRPYTTRLTDTLAFYLSGVDYLEVDDRAWVAWFWGHVHYLTPFPQKTNFAFLDKTSLYLDKILGCWEFNEGSGGPYDLITGTKSTIQSNLTWVGISNINIASTTAKPCDTNINYFSLTDQLTVLISFKPTVQSGDKYLVNKYFVGGGEFYVIINGLDTIEFHVNTDDGAVTKTETTLSMATDEVTDVVCTYDGSDLRIYAQQNDVGSFTEYTGDAQSQTGNINKTNYNLIIGSYETGSVFNGDIYHCMVFAKELSTAEMLSYSASGTAERNYGDNEQYINSLGLPQSIDNAGLAFDSSWHVTGESDIEVAWGSDRINPVIVLDDYPITYGDHRSPTNPLINHLNFDDNAATAILVALTGSNGNWEDQSDGSDFNTEDYIVTDAMRATALDTQDGAAYADIALGAHLNAFFISGAVILQIKPQFAYDDAGDQTLFHCYISANDQLLLTYDAANDRYEFAVSWGSTTVTVNSVAYTDDITLQQYTTIHILWDSTTDIIGLIVNSTVAIGFNAGTPSGSNPTKVTIGAEQGRANPADAFLDLFKSYSTPFLPYGAYFTHNSTGSYSDAHANVSFFWNGSDTTPIGGNVTSNGDYTQDGPGSVKAFRNDAAGEYASAAISGNIASSEGTLSFWFKANSALGSDQTFFYGDTDFKLWWDDSESDLVFTYGGDTVQTTAAITNETEWHHVRIGWLASKEIFIEVDHVKDINITTIDANPAISGTMYFTADDAAGTNRADIMMSDVYITDSIDTPQIPFIIGQGAAHMPLRFTS